jgi:hypothetical protein
MSRTLMAVAAVVAALALAGDAEARRRAVSHPDPEFNIAYTEGGYADRTSVIQGQAIRLHIATSASPFTLRIVNLADPTRVLTTRTLTSAARNCSGKAAEGCDWPATVTIAVPSNWRSGYYAATFPTALGERNIIFVVREANPGSWSRTVIVSPTHTYHGYNDFGGKSFFPNEWPLRSEELSFDRPYSQEAGLGRYPIWERQFVDWMTSENRRFEVITDTDLEDSTLLSRYDLVIFVGHSEYWTSSARAHLETYSRNGGHVAIFGGNTMWWQVRLSDFGRTMVAYKNDAARYDPALQIAAGLVTTNFYSHPVNQPENRILGASFRNGGYANKVDAPDDFSLKPLEQRTPFTVTESTHWVFNGTGLTNGETFGREVTGVEVDGVTFNCDRTGRAVAPDGSDEAPLNYHILATIPASLGWGTMGIYVNSAGGAVFNAATQGWANGLTTSEDVQQITRNVLDRLGGGAAQQYDPAQTSVVAQDTFNCPPTFITAPGWEGTEGRGTVTSACAFEGPGGLELSGPLPIALSRRIAPATQSRSHVELRFYIKADETVQRTVFPMPLITLRQREADIVREVALVEVDASTDTKRIRIARRDPQGTFIATPEWISLSSGWHLVEATWRSPGILELQVDGGQKLTLDNPAAGQTANELVIGLPAPQTSAAGRVCIDAIAAATQKLGAVPPLM